MCSSVILMQHTGHAVYSTRLSSLQETAIGLKLNGAAISSFLAGTTSQGAVLSSW